MAIFNQFYGDLPDYAPISITEFKQAISQYMAPYTIEDLGRPKNTIGKQLSHITKCHLLQKYLSFMYLVFSSMHQPRMKKELVRFENVSKKQFSKQLQELFITLCSNITLIMNPFTFLIFDLFCV